MSLDNIDKLIEDGTIVACYIRDLNALSIIEDKKKYGNYRFSSEPIKVPNTYNDCVTILYKIDDENYVEYFSKKEISVIDDSLNNSKTFSDSMEIYETKYKKHPIVINKKDLRKIGPDEKEKFKITMRCNIIASIIETKFKSAKDTLTLQFEELPLENQRKEYVNLIFDEIKELEMPAFLIQLNRLREMTIDSEDYINGFRHTLVCGKRTYPEKTTSKFYTLLVKDSENTYTEYYTQKQVISEEYLKKYHLLNTSDIDDFRKSYCHALNRPIVAPTNLAEFNEMTKEFLEVNYQHDEDIRELIKTIFEKAGSYLHEKYDRIKEVDEEDAYVDNTLYDIAMTLEKKNKTD